MSDNKVNENFLKAMDSIKAMADANTIIGESITTSNGTTIIPVSKVTMGYASGGLDYAPKKVTPAPKTNNYGGVGGSGMTISPVAFLIISPTGAVEVQNVNQPMGAADPISSVIGLIERSPDLIERLRNALSKDKKAD